MNKLGIIGGMGPFADEAFISLINSYCPESTDSKHIPFLLDGNCARPDRSDFICKKSRNSPLDSLLTSTRMLVRCGCDCIVIPCNTAHFWYSDIKELLPKYIDFPSIVSLSVNACAKKSQSAILLATDGTRLCGIYDRACQMSGIKLVSVPKGLSSLTRDLIFSVKAGKSADISSLLHESSYYCDSLILACTELSYALLKSQRANILGLNITDSLSVLAQYVLKKYYKKPFLLPHT